MSIRWRYGLFILAIHLVIGILVFQLLKDNKLWFIAAEVLLMSSLILAYKIYKDIIRPFRFLQSGIDALADQDFSIRFRTTGSKTMNQLITVYNTMLDNIQEERLQVKEQHFFLEKLITASPAGIILLDYDGRITDINPQAKAILELQENPHKMTLNDIPHPILMEIAKWNVGKSGIVKGKSQEQLRCEIAQFVHRGFPRKFITIQELSRELLAAEKRAYGKVIRMMAHEVNNSIGAINSILQTTIEAYPIDPEDDLADDIIQSLHVAIDRNKRMNTFMRNFAQVLRLPEPCLQPYDLQELLHHVFYLMAPVAQAQNTEIQIEVPQTNTIHLIDEKLMEQALVNMVQNALESLKRGGHIKLRLDTKPLQFVVADNGSGIAEDVADKIGTPFFSTKPDGQGIGLTIIREIADKHNAHAQLETLPSGWTESRIIFRSI